MRRARRSGMCACLASILALNLASLAWHPGFAAEMPRPEDGLVAGGVYANAYFDLSYPLPAGWTEDVAGPPPSVTGYYVLASLVPAGERNGTVLIAAQDLFFVGAMRDDATAAADEFAAAMARIAGMRIDRPPSKVALAGRNFGRVDFSGVGLYRSTLLTVSRCHLLSINLTAKSPAALAALVASLDRLNDAHADAPASPHPLCVANHATSDNVRTRVDPPPSSPAFTPIPVRIVIGDDGGVKHVHVIRASPEQRTGIEAALGRWKFRPYAIDGRATEIETGLLIEFRADGAVVYSAGGGR